MDEAGIEQRGVAPVEPQLKAIDAIADKAGLARAGDVRADVDLLNATNFYTDRLFGLWVSVDLLQPDRNAPYLVQGGLGMPDRDFYLGGTAWPNCASSTRPTSHRCCSWPASPIRPARHNAFSRWRRRSRRHMPPRKKPMM